MQSTSRGRPYYLAVLAVLVLGIAGITLKILRTEPAPPPAPTPRTLISDPLPHRAACDFRRPWQELVRPGDTQDYIGRVRLLLQSQAERTEAFRSMLRSRGNVLAGGNEAACIAGRFAAPNDYRLDIEPLAACDQPHPGFLEVKFKLEVERRGESFLNTLDLKVGLGDISTTSIGAFAAAQLRLMDDGYRGWSKAYPNYFKLAQNSFGLAGIDMIPVATLGAQALKLRLNWLNQAMVHWLPQWATYLMKLSDLATVKTRIEIDNKSTLLQSRIDTLASGLELMVTSRDGGLVPQVPSSSDAPAYGEVFQLQNPRSTPFNIHHDVVVRFRGLIIKIDNLTFAGQFQSGPRLMAHHGRFQGADKVELSGSYRGLSMSGMGKAIKELVEELIHEEINRVKNSNGGDGWRFKIAVHSDEGVNYLNLWTRLESKVNFLNLLREDKDATGAAVLPDKAMLKDLNRWAIDAMDAISQDHRSAPCEP